MTALKQYQRLEAPGLWRASPEAQRLNVAVSIGDATLTLCDLGDTPRAHWSLAAVVRRNPGAIPAVYAPSADPREPESLEIDDPDMIDAIETVRRAIDRARPRAGRLRLVITTVLFAAALLLVVFWLPDALVRHTVSVLPDAARAAVGERLLDHVRRITGSPCGDKRAQAALDRLAVRLLGPDAAGRVRVVPSGVAEARHLPGGIILLNRSELEDHDTPEVAAGHILAEAERAAEADPMVALLDYAGPFATARLLTTGMLPEGVLDGYGEVIFTAAPAPVAAEPLLARFAAAGVPSTPYAFAVDRTGETTLSLIEADPFAAGAPEPLMPDADWTRLKSICAQ